FARLTSGDSKKIRAGHTVLFLKIGRGIVAEWSHVGACNIWSDADLSDAPKMYKRMYTADEVQLTDSVGTELDSNRFRIWHRKPKRYVWQDKVAAKIQYMTGHRIPQSSYAVR